jgi:ADP-ribose pyrophosphatase
MSNEMKFDIKKIKEIDIPFVGAIIERTHNGETEVLLQTRWKPQTDPIYSGTFEFPSGALGKIFENIYKTLEREVYEETGLKLKTVKGDSQTKIFSTNKDDAAFGFKSFCNVQQLKNGLPWIGFIFICEVEDTEPKAQKTEVKEIKWMKKEEVKYLFESNPEKLFTLDLPAWEYYFKQ